MELIVEQSVFLKMIIGMDTLGAMLKMGHSCF